MITKQDIAYMQRAIALAKTGIYTTRPNPAVGCVLVNDVGQGAQIIGEGYHYRAGEPHAEVHALRNAAENGFSTEGATVYVTLEPCAHTGKTPPCADALVAAKVAKVVIAVKDPHHKVAGKGIAKLQAAGIDVITGVCEAEAMALNQGFLKVMSGGLPYVRLKIAASLDGRTAMASGESKWITGAAARQDVQHWRAISGAIITGSETVLQDDPALNVRTGFKVSNTEIPLADIPQPIRVVLDRRNRVDINFKLLNDGQTTLVFGHDNADLAQVLTTLRDEHQVNDVLLECGGTLAASFLEADLVDEIILYQAPVFLGASARPMLNFAIEKLADKKQFGINQVVEIDGNLRIMLKKVSFNQ